LAIVTSHRARRGAIIEVNARGGTTLPRVYAAALVAVLPCITGLAEMPDVPSGQLRPWRTEAEVGNAKAVRTI